MKSEKRIVRPREVRATGDNQIEAVVLVYNVIDDYNTRFRPGCFTDSLKTRMPRITWGHDWRDVIGRWVDYRDNDIELVLIGELDDFDAVPRARQAHAQLLSGTIDQFSVGFERLSDEAVDPADVDGMRGVVDITKGNLDEAALVLAGAVPGTRPLAIRTARGKSVDIDAVMEIAKRVDSGELTHAQAEVALNLVTEDDGSTPPPPKETPPVPDAMDVALDAEELDRLDA